MEPTLKVILAGNLREAQQWAVANGLPSNPLPGNGWIYARGVDTLYGLTNFKHLIVGTFWDRPDSFKIWEAIRIRER